MGKLNDENYKGYLITFEKTKDFYDEKSIQVTIFEMSKHSKQYIGKTQYLSSTKKLGIERAKYWIDNRIKTEFKYNLKEIKLTGAESNIKQPNTFKSFKEFEKALMTIVSREKKENGGYTKVWFEIIWNDGTKLQDRLDIGVNDWIGQVPLGDYIKSYNNKYDKYQWN